MEREQPTVMTKLWHWFEHFIGVVMSQPPCFCRYDPKGHEHGGDVVLESRVDCCFRPHGGKGVGDLQSAGVSWGCLIGVRPPIRLAVGGMDRELRVD